MKFNIAQKIFAIALVVLALMLCVAVYSIQLTSGISNDLRAIAGQHLPTSRAVGNINVKILNQGIVLQRLFVLSEDGSVAIKSVAQNTAKFDALGLDVIAIFDATRIKLKRAGETRIATKLKAIEREYKTFEAHGRDMLSAHEESDLPAFVALQKTLNARQDAIDLEITNLHDQMAAITGQAVQHANSEEQNLLIVNSLLTALAALFALLFAAIVSRLLVRALRDLATGAEAVQNGDLDTEVLVTTRDEVGQLTQDFNGMVDGLRLKERIKDTFGKYMDPRIVANLLESPEFSKPGGVRREMTVMFIDLKGFTSISEVLEPNDLVYMVNDFFSHMTDAISQNKGVVDKYMGDAVMAYWGEPFCDAKDHAQLACQAAQQALAKLETFRADVRAKLGDKADDLDLDLRIGVSSGEMILGTIGSKACRNFTVMGDPVNLGSRLEGANKAYGTRILISDRTRELASKDLSFREIDMIRVKGKNKPVRVHELVSNDVEDETFAKALKAYRQQDWDTAEDAFNKSPDDIAAQVYLQRISQLRSTPPPSDWDGVWVFETK